jgi:RNA polymerase sigma-70 factor, ECF subfamily
MVCHDDFATAYRNSFILTTRFLQSRGLPPEEAQEFAQAAWVCGWEKRGQLRDDCLLRTWVNRIAWNLAMNVHRSPATVPLVTSEVAAGEFTTDRELSAQQLLQLAPPQDRQLLYARFYLGDSDQELAERFGIRPECLRIRIYRAKERLRERVARRIREDRLR